MIGRQIGRYTITEELGRGGMGVVYRATQVTLNRTVAVKMLFPHLATTSEYLARFRREAETLARLDHENVVRIYDIEEYEDTHCIIMEYVPGLSLSRVLARERRLPPHRARAIAADIAGALSAAHRQGIIHRDIKPDNILFSADGRPKLTDFGIARMADANAATRTGIMIGTPSYMSPEQAAGRAVTPASDLYSLGVVLFEMLSGRVPFIGGDALAVALMHLSEPAPRLDGLVRALPAAVSDLVARTLAKNPAERFTAAHELREALLALHLPAESGQMEPSLSAAAGPVCPECSFELREDFLTCPRCGLSIRQRCSRCERLFDPLSDECPFCRTPATPLPVLSVPVLSLPEASLPGTRVAPSDEALRQSGARSVATGAELPGSSSGAVSPIAPATSKPAVQSGSSAPAAGGALAIGAGIAGDAVVGVRQLGERVLAALPWLPRRRQLRTRPVVLWIGAGLLLVWVGFAALWPAGTPTRRPVDVGGGAVAGGGASGAPVTAAATGGQTQLTPDDIDAISRAAGDSTGQPAGNGGSTPVREKGPEPAAPSSPGKPLPTPDEPVTPAPGDEEVMRGNMAATEAARQSIIEIVDRQRTATETGDVELLLRDVAPELRGEVLSSFREMHATAGAIRSLITRVSVGFGDDGTAQVKFHAKLTGIRIRDGHPVTIYDGAVVWTLERRDGRWLITET